MSRDDPDQPVDDGDQGDQRDEGEPIVVPSVPGYGSPPPVADPGGPEPAIYGIPPQWHPEREPGDSEPGDSEPDVDAGG